VYITPGLDVRVKGSEFDFKFANTLESRVIIFAEVKNNVIIVRLVGSKKDKQNSPAIESEIVQKFKPSVIQVENSALEQGQKKLLSPGVEGIKVNVYGNGKLLYTDTYAAVEMMVEVGPDTEWNDDNK
jgi:vancomycin resistance protein YoaR